MKQEITVERVTEVLFGLDFCEAAFGSDSPFRIDEWDRDGVNRMAAGLEAAERLLSEKFPRIIAAAKPLAALHALEDLFEANLMRCYCPKFIARLMSGAADRVENLTEVCRMLRWLAGELDQLPVKDDPPDHLGGETYLTHEQHEVLVTALDEIRMVVGLPSQEPIPRVCKGQRPTMVPYRQYPPPPQNVSPYPAFPVVTGIVVPPPPPSANSNHRDDKYAQARRWIAKRTKAKYG